ncbi:PolC-type DNA polymerase III [Glaciimonas sp. PAMC28666]|uniref:3'-5' exonuclease n=1 Tax=Glaciimonas sp. PAMC28666 TaxID=2807626 RepID=UPI001963B3CB|nr:3'-5' exonuclease [Glaciimonas sp. PAMC28666]QRX82352.1 3'-5' exonuclease [Glaciimonas sp. PAMC28666]
MTVYQKPIVMLDFETTGLSPEMGDRITEVAALRIVEGKIVERFVSLVNCGVSIPPFISHLTGISQAMVDRAPSASKVMPELLRFIGNDALAAHNASFDAKFLLKESALLDLQPRHSALICSLKLSRRVFPGMKSYKLGLLASALQIPFLGNAHRAEADAEVSAHLLLHVAKHLTDRYQVTSIHPDLLVAVNKLAAAKVPKFLAGQLYGQY